MHSPAKVGKVAAMSMKLDFTGPKPHDNNQQTATLFVSLYVVVLAFFILLASHAQYDVEKSRNVLDSVNKAFAKEIKVDTSWVMESMGTEISATNIFNDIEGVITSVVPLEEIKVITDGRRMVIRMSADALFEAGSADLRPERSALYRRLSNTLTQWHKDGATMELTFTQGVKKQKNPAPAAYDLEIARGGNLARLLENRGVAPENLTIGMAEDAPGELRFEFILQSMNPPVSASSITSEGGGN